MQYDLSNLQSLYDGYKSQARSYLSQYKSRVNQLGDTMNAMTKLIYWQRKLERYGATIFIILILIYLFYQYRKRKKIPFRRKGKGFVGYQSKI